MLALMVTVNLSLDEELAKRIEALAKKQGTSVEKYFIEAARERVEGTESLLADVQAGLAEAKAGRGSSISDVEKRLSQKLFAEKQR